MRLSKLSFLLVLVLLVLAVQPTVHGAVSVTITPGSQVVAQFGVATYAISLPGAMYPGFPYSLSLSGSLTSFPFSPNPVSPPATSTLTIDLSRTFACPGTYPFTVTATNSTGHGPGTVTDTGTGTATLTVVQYGPPLQVTVTTDKPTYRVGDTVTIQLTANRPTNNGLLTITPPSGSPTTIFVPYPGYSFSYSLTKTLTVSQIGRYSVNFQADDFCSGFNSAVAYFDVTPDTYSVTISLGGVPPQVSANIQIDGQGQGTISGSDIKTLAFKLDTTHTISVDQYVPGATGVRYYAAQNSWTVSSGGSHTFSYDTQYLFAVGTNPDGVAQLTGGGWFTAGTSAQTSQAPQTITGGPGTQYIFKGWEVDGVLQSNNPVTVTLDKPHKAIAKYATQYQLVVDSAYGDPKGSGYYDAGSTAQFSVTSPAGFFIQQVFVKWEGDYTGTSPQGSIVMDTPKVLHATWTTSYMQLYVAVAAIAAVIIGGFLFWRRRQATPPATKPTPAEPGEPGPSEAPTAESGEATGAAGANSSKCASCGTDVPAGQAFCHNCGAKMS